MNPINSPRHAFAPLQRWMQAVIMHPEGVEAGMNSPAARDEIDAAPDEAEQVVTRSRALTAVERLAIYGSAYYGRLLECLREEFPATAHALGEETFDAFAAAYLQNYPSRSYTLTQLGKNFPSFLVETRPEREPGEPEVSWPEFLADLARFEWTFSEVFDGPGVEGKDVVDAAAFRAIDCSPEAHCRSMVGPATVTGRPARIAALRATLTPVVPCCMAQPITTSSTVPGSMPERLTAWAMTCPAKVGPSVLLRAPR